MEERVKELEKQVKSLQHNLGELVRLQTEIIKTVNKQGDVINEISKLNELQSLAIEGMAREIGAYN